jgi:hypothetical protein
LKGRDDLKRLIAVLLSMLMILSMTAVGFATVDEDDYKVVIEKPLDEVRLFNDSDKFFVSGYIMANQLDDIDWIEIQVDNLTAERIYDNDSEFNDIVSPWSNDKFKFNFVVDPKDWDIEESDSDNVYEITVTAYIDPANSSVPNQEKHDTESVEILYGYATAYDIQITHPASNLVVSSWSNDPLIKGWIKADEGDVLESLVIEIQKIGESGKVTMKLIDESSEFVTMSNDKYYFEKKWDVTQTGDFRITVEAVLDVDERVDDRTLNDSHDVKVTLNPNYEDDEDEAMEAYPAAPAVAGKILKSYGIPNNVGGKNLIALVAKEMGPGTNFKGIAKTNTVQYKTAITDFLEDQLGVANLGNYVVVKKTGGGKPEAVSNGNKKIK